MVLNIFYGKQLTPYSNYLKFTICFLFSTCSKRNGFRVRVQPLNACAGRVTPLRRKTTRCIAMKVARTARASQAVGCDFMTHGVCLGMGPYMTWDIIPQKMHVFFENKKWYTGGWHFVVFLCVLQFSNLQGQVECHFVELPQGRLF